MNTLNKRPVTIIALDWFEPSQTSKFDLILFVSLVHINLVRNSVVVSLLFSSSQTGIRDQYQIYKINELPHMFLISAPLLAAEFDAIFKVIHIHLIFWGDWQYLFQENRDTLFSGIGTLVTECPVMNTLNKRPVTYIALDWFEPSQRSKLF